MKKEGYYSSGQFAKMAHVSVRTIRYYDKLKLLTPTFVSDSGARFYTDQDLARLQQILLLKYLGFSLDDIREMLIGDMDYQMMQSSLMIQKKLIQDRIERMQLVAQAIDNTTQAIEAVHAIDWTHMIELIHLTNEETSIRSQYNNASNISARIRLHRDYSENKYGWFPWLYDICELNTVCDDISVLEIGSGDGTLWTENANRHGKAVKVLVSDISDGMLRDARRNINEAYGDRKNGFEYLVIDARDIPFDNDSFDVVIANHVLFYVDDVEKGLSEIRRVLKPGGRFICSTYGQNHMKEITELVQRFDDRIMLSGDILYERFGLDNGRDILKGYFDSIDIRRYDDRIYIEEAEPLIEYILSCHGNQNSILLEKYKEFREFVEKKVSKGYVISKDAGAFVCR